MDRQLRQERRIKALDSELKTSTTKTDEMKALLESKNVEVEAMRIGFRKTESLLLNRILDLEKDNNGLSHMDLIFKSPDYLLLKEKSELFQIRLDEMERAQASSVITMENNGNATNTDDLYNSISNISKEVAVLRSKLTVPSMIGSSEFGKPIRIGDSMMGGPGDITAYLQLRV